MYILLPHDYRNDITLMWKRFSTDFIISGYQYPSLYICFFPCVQDIDECNEASDQLCQHQCVNTPSTYHCECHPGYSLLNDGVNCEGQLL